MTAPDVWTDREHDRVMVDAIVGRLSLTRDEAVRLANQLTDAVDELEAVSES